MTDRQFIILMAVLQLAVWAVGIYMLLNFFWVTCALFGIFAIMEHVEKTTKLFYQFYKDHW